MFTSISPLVWIAVAVIVIIVVLWISPRPRGNVFDVLQLGSCLGDVIGCFTISLAVIVTAGTTLIATLSRIL